MKQLVVRLHDLKLLTSYGRLKVTCCLMTVIVLSLLAKRKRVIATKITQVVVSASVLTCNKQPNTKAASLKVAFFVERTSMTDHQMWNKYLRERNPAMRDWYATKLKERGNNGSKTAKKYAEQTHLNNKANR